MKKVLIPVKRASMALLLGGALLAGTSACSTGTGDGEVNVEESDFKDKSPTEHNAPGTSDNTQDNNGRPTPGATTPDSAYEEVYDRQQEKTEQRKDGGTAGNQAFGGAAETKKDDK
ncbi:MAG: hypothetical protein ACO1OQ_14075 [Rufibacter sp.]